ncbi:MAG: iron ABC transporter permease [Elusimicrobia bacterium]|nr:iron ABC transporter permease [Elusimicrobiota bacterium]
MKKNYFILFLLIFTLILTFIVSLIFGGTKISFTELLSGLSSVPGINHTIIWKIRIPRILLSMLVGAGLAASGSVLQGILRNPLAEPYTLGISGGAAFGATIAVVLGISSLSLPVCAFLGALLSLLFVYLIASKKNFSVSTLILGGVILSFLFSAIILLIFAVSKTEKIQSTLLWLMGDLSNAETGLTTIVAGFTVAGIAILLLFSREIDILTLGEEKASYLGVDSANTIRTIFIIASFITGACVSASGIIGFVGLIIPHFIRKWSGPKHFTLIIFSSLAGAIFLCIADTFARSIIYPVELPVGVITGIFGGVFFIIFLLRSKNWEVF